MPTKMPNIEELLQEPREEDRSSLLERAAEAVLYANVDLSKLTKDQHDRVAVLQATAGAAAVQVNLATPSLRRV